MCDDCRSWCRNEASTGVRRSLCRDCMRGSLTSLPVRPLFAVLGVQLLLGVVFVALVVSGALPLSSDGKPGSGAARVNRFDGPAAWGLLKMQVELGARPAGSAPSRELSARLKKLLPHGRYQAVKGGLRNVVGRVPGRDRGRYIV